MWSGGKRPPSTGKGERERGFKSVLLNPKGKIYGKRCDRAVTRGLTGKQCRIPGQPFLVRSKPERQVSTSLKRGSDRAKENDQYILEKKKPGPTALVRTWRATERS